MIASISRKYDLPNVKVFSQGFLWYVHESGLNRNFPYVFSLKVILSSLPSHWLLDFVLMKNLLFLFYCFIFSLSIFKYQDMEFDEIKYPWIHLTLIWRNDCLCQRKQKDWQRKSHFEFARFNWGCFGDPYVMTRGRTRDDLGTQWSLKWTYCWCFG